MRGHRDWCRGIGDKASPGINYRGKIKLVSSCSAHEALQSCTGMAEIATDAVAVVKGTRQLFYN
jgi:hypothetical protein